MLLMNAPNIKVQLSRRFPLIPWMRCRTPRGNKKPCWRSCLTSRWFVQRYGDLNQRILVGKGDFAQLSFPREGALPISTSKRFGPAIAAAVSCARVGGNAVVGTAADVHPPTLMTYTTDLVGDVLDRFGNWY